MSSDSFQTALREEEGRLRKALAEQAKQAALFPLTPNPDVQELERVVRLRAATAEHSYLRSNRWFFLTVAASALVILILLLTHPSAGHVSVSATSSAVVVETTAKTQIGDLGDLFPDFRLTAVHGASVVRDALDNDLASGAGEKSAWIDPPGRLSRLSAAGEATLVIEECGSATCAVSLIGPSVEALISLKAAAVCVSPAQSACGTESATKRRLDNNLQVRSSQKLSFELTRQAGAAADRSDIARPLVLLEGPLRRIAFDRQEGQLGLPTGRLSTLSKGTVAFHDFGPNAVASLLYRTVRVVGPSGIVEIHLRGSSIETSFVGQADDVRSAVASAKTETNVPSVLEWLAGNKTASLLGVAISFGVAFGLAVIRRATGNEKV